MNRNASKINLTVGLALSLSVAACGGSMDAVDGDLDQEQELRSSEQLACAMLKDEASCSRRADCQWRPAASCAGLGCPQPPPPCQPRAKTVVFDYDLSRSSQGVVAGFADYPQANKEAYELSAGWSPLPAPLSGYGFNLSGDNHCDDLWMYFTKKLTGLKADTSYQLAFEVWFATDAPKNCGGVGGAPGESVWVKAGAADHQPLAAPDGNGWLRMNVDKGAQMAGGKDALMIGNVATSNTDCRHPVYELKSLSSGQMPMTVKTDSTGSLWAFFGTDSGFEAKTNLYYTRVTITATETGNSSIVTAQ